MFIAVPIIIVIVVVNIIKKSKNNNASTSTISENIKNRLGSSKVSSNKCEYCGSNLDDSKTHCENCGANKSVK